MTETKLDFRAVFLREFVSSLIRNTRNIRFMTEKGIPSIRELDELESHIVSAETEKKAGKEISEEEIMKAIKTIPEESTIQNPEEKISSLINDAEIKSIECPGPDKQLIVSKSGSVFPVAVSLSSEEIDAIVEDFAKQSGEEIHRGILKAQAENLSITAVVSEYLGTRFIIQKQ